MNNKYRLIIIFFLLLSMILSSCGPSQTVQSTVIPSATIIPSATNNPIPTVTPLPMPWGPPVLMNIIQIIESNGFEISKENSLAINPSRIYINSNLVDSEVTLYSVGIVELNFSYFVTTENSQEGSIFNSIINCYPENIRLWVQNSMNTLSLVDPSKINEGGLNSTFSETVEGYSLILELSIDQQDLRYTLKIRPLSLANLVQGEINNLTQSNLYVLAYSQTTSGYYWTNTFLPSKYILVYLPVDQYQIVAYDASGSVIGGCPNMVTAIANESAICNITDSIGQYPPLPAEIQ